MPSTLNGAPPRTSRLDRPANPRPFRIQERDLLILEQVARFRFLTATQIAQLVPGSDQRIGRRIRLLFFHGYLDCPRVQRNQLAHVFETGNFPLVYGLGLKGARLLAPRVDWIDDRLDWTTNNSRVTAPHLAHTIETAAVMIDFERACMSANLRLMDQHEILALMPGSNRTTRRSHNPFKLKPSVLLPGQREPLDIAVIPDRLFALATAAHRANFALELDRGEMDVDARKLQGKSSIRRKIIGYWHAWRQDLHRSQWNCGSFRVLFVTPSESRMHNMINVVNKVIPGGSNIFVFSTPERLASAGVLGPAWMTGKRGEVALMS